MRCNDVQDILPTIIDIHGFALLLPSIHARIHVRHDGIHESHESELDPIGMGYLPIVQHSCNDTSEFQRLNSPT